MGSMLMKTTIAGVTTLIVWNRILSNEDLYYGGMVIAGAALVVSLVYLCITHIKMIRLQAQLETEYGIRKKK